MLTTASAIDLCSDDLHAITQPTLITEAIRCRILYQTESFSVRFDIIIYPL